MKVALLISGANKARYRRLKEQLANNYLLGTDQYPNTLEKTTRILGNYQGTRPSQFGWQKRKGGGLAFIQKGGCGLQGRGTGRGGGNAAQDNTAQQVDARDAGRGGSDMASTTYTGASSQTRTNSVGESHCYHCGEVGHWARECPAHKAEQ